MQHKVVAIFFIKMDFRLTTKSNHLLNQGARAILSRCTSQWPLRVSRRIVMETKAKRKKYRWRGCYYGDDDV